MPNARNVERPITLMGLGRSGTTLVTNIFKRHPQTQAIGETANFVYSTYYHVLNALPVCGERKARESLEEAAARSVHAMLVRTFPSRKAAWFHKPIRMPLVSQRFGRQPQHFSKFADFYWEATEALFPGGRFLTVLRDPEEVLISSLTRWKMPPAAAVKMLDDNYQLMLHEKSRVGLHLSFEDLATDGEATVRRLLGFAGVSYHPACLAAFESKHAVNPPRDEARECPEIPAETRRKYEELRERISR